MEQRDDRSPKKRINISITEKTYELLRNQAFRNNATMSQMISNWIWYEESLSEQIRLNRDWVKELDVETMERLLQYCYENHCNPAQAVTKWIWSAKVKCQNIRGQMSLLQ